MIEFQ